MKHHLLRWLTCISFLTCLAFSARAEANFIYIIGNDNQWEMPCTDNADFFADRKLYETSPGSNIYEGLFPFSPTSWFRFISELPVAKDEYDSSVYRQNVIAPMADSTPMEPLGKSGLFTTSTVKVESFCAPMIEPGTWKFASGLNYQMVYKVLVNLNVNKIFLIPSVGMVVVHDGMPTPTLDNAADYMSASGYQDYIPAGKLSFNYYDFNRDEWWNNASTEELTNGANEISFNAQHEKAAGYVKSDWKGGVLTIPYSSYIRLQENSSTAPSEDVMYVHRSTDNFTPWDGASSEVVSNFEQLTPDGEGNYVGNVTVSANEKINFISALDGTQAANSVICPQADRTMNFNEASGMYFSSAVVANQSAGAYWIAPGEKDSYNYTVTVTPGDKPVVKFEGEKTPNEIYLIGSPQGWDITSGSMPLKKTVNGGYYGSYNIAAGDVLFRFYTALGNWESNSLGSQYDDMSIDNGTIDGETSYRLYVGGKGSFEFSSWSGGMMYMYVEPSASKVTFSTAPIAAAGEYAQEITDPKGVEGLYGEDGEAYAKHSDGMYYINFAIYNDSEAEVIKLYTYNLPISREEPEAEGSFALTLPDGHQWEFDEFGVAEASFEIQDGVTAKAPNHVIVKNREDEMGRSYCLAVDMENRKMYLERKGDVAYLIGILTDGEKPTYATRQQFKDYAVKNGSGLVNVPQNKLDFIYMPSISDAISFNDGNSLDPIALTFNDKGIATFSAMVSIFRLTADQWAGGNLYVSPNAVMDAKNLNEIHAVMGAYEAIKISTLIETAPDSKIFEGDVMFDNVAQKQYLSFMLDKPDENGSAFIALASPAYMNGVGIANYMKSRTVVAKNGVMSSAMRFEGYNFELPSVKGSGVLKVKVDLNTMEMTAQLPEENKASVYESVADNSSLDEVVASQSSTVDNAVTLDAQVNVEEGEAAEFNFASPEGEVIVPASGQSTAINFGTDGVWEGDFVKVSTPQRSRSAARKAAAANDAKWSLSLPDGVSSSNVAMLINEETKKIKVFSSAHKSDGFFLVTYEDGVIYGFDVRPDIEHIDALPQIAKVSDGLYKGEITVPEAGLRMRVASSLLNNSTGFSGLSAFSYDELYTAFELSETDNEKSQPAWNMPNASEWIVKAPAGKATVTYDEKTGKLTVRSDAGLGCEDLTVDNGTSLRIVVGDGCVTVMSDGNADLDFVSPAGAIAKHVSVTAGTTTVNIAPGFYIVAGQKIFVK